MAIGSDYAQGYGLGLRKRAMDEAEDDKALNTYQALYGNRRAMGGHINLNTVGEGIDAREVRAQAMEKYLNEKAKDLELKENFSTPMATIQQRQIEAEEDARNKERMDKATSERVAAEERAAKSDQAAAVTEQQHHQKLLNDAIQGMYVGDPDSVKTYFEVFGSPGVQVRDVQRAANGQITIDFGEDGTQVFQNADEAVQKIMVPAAMIAKGQTGGKGLNTGSASVKDVTEYKKQIIDKWYETHDEDPPAGYVDKRMAMVYGGGEDTASKKTSTTNVQTSKGIPRITGTVTQDGKKVTVDSQGNIVRRGLQPKAEPAGKESVVGGEKVGAIVKPNQVKKIADIKLPEGITKMSEALAWLMKDKANFPNEDRARAWLKKYGPKEQPAKAQPATKPALKGDRNIPEQKKARVEARVAEERKDFDRKAQRATTMWVDRDGIVWGKDSKGQTFRIARAPRKTYGASKTVNPTYEAYKRFIADNGIETKQNKGLYAKR